jgi:hypothetical protein
LIKRKTRILLETDESRTRRAFAVVDVRLVGSRGFDVRELGPNFVARLVSVYKVEARNI